MNNKLLALGIPTYKRPDYAISSLKDAISLDTYDEIILSCNSFEPLIEKFINSLENKEKIVYKLQKENVGLSQNYSDIIKLTSCDYVHIISDEDHLIQDNVQDFHSFLGQNNDFSLFLVSALDENGLISRLSPKLI